MWNVLLFEESLGCGRVSSDAQYIVGKQNVLQMPGTVSMVTHLVYMQLFIPCTPYNVVNRSTQSILWGAVWEEATCGCRSGLIATNCEVHTYATTICGEQFLKVVRAHRHPCLSLVLLA